MVEPSTSKLTLINDVTEKNLPAAHKEANSASFPEQLKDLTRGQGHGHSQVVEKHKKLQSRWYKENKGGTRKIIFIAFDLLV
ncbi:hypothetical protein RRG08_047550 [Elysia crispata]|uniref:Uncharacterized protein n=1 Tax=Elysia crispata TaxID=231223 RepID=A0AAE1D204_9GAST|nr:hypothetical protein RRG08_047550 [Elysia crispata]